MDKLEYYRDTIKKMTNLCVVDDLLAAGISKGDIVLGFHHPSKRPLTEFATV